MSVRAASYSLLELNQYIRRVISLNFEEPLWIECEIGQVSQSRGHWYLDLIQKEDDQIVAQCQAALWANVYFFLRKKSPVAPEDILQQGIAVKLKVNVDFHERYGMKLIIEDIDSSFTIGKLEMQRQAILKEIQSRGLIRKNAEQPLPSAIQHLAVISSGKAAGYADFIHHLEDNPFGYNVAIDLYTSAMQGMQVEAEMLDCLKQIEKKSNRYDAVAIIRGGGGRTDLGAFDNLPIALHIAAYPLPVLIGIGHEIDQSVLDLVAHASLKTPTAVADFIIEHNSRFENRLDQLHDIFLQEIRNRLHQEQSRMHEISFGLAHSVRSRLVAESEHLMYQHKVLQRVTQHMADKQFQRLDYLTSILHALDPDQVLARGYSITSCEGKTIRLAQELTSGKKIQTTFLDGTIKSIVE